MPYIFRITLFITLGLLLMSGCFGDGNNPFDPDNCVPDRISDAHITYADSTDDVYLIWTSPDYCRKSDTVERYEIRYLYDDPFDWENALPVIDPPAAMPPGEIQTYRLRYPDRGRALFMAIASVGTSGKPSDPSNIAVLNVPGFALTGVCRNVFTGISLPGIEVIVRESSDTYTVITDANGEFFLADLAPQVLEIEIRFDTNDPSYFNLSQQFVITEDSAPAFFLIPHQMSEVLPSVSLLSLFKTVATYSAFGTSRELIKWALRPVQTYIPPYINSEGIDYGTLARSAVQRWMDRTGYELFQFVEAPPATGVEFHFLTRAEMGSLSGITRHTYDSDGLPLKDDVQIVDDLSDSTFVYRVLLHETGHTLQFKHLSNQQFIMYPSHPLPGDISNDEVWLVNLLESLPNRTNIDIYQNVEPLQ